MLTLSRVSTIINAHSLAADGRLFFHLERRLSQDTPSQAPPATPADERAVFDDAAERHQKRNFLGMLLWQVVHRQAWIYKTESVVISTFARSLGASTSMVGLFPFISRLGKFLPQAFAGRAMEPLKRKMPAVKVLALAYGLLWLLLGTILIHSGVQRSWTFWTYFGIYAASWCVMGAVIVGIGTLRGKLIRPDLRGSLLGAQHMIGGLIALSMVYVLHRLLNGDATNVYTFGCLFLIAGVLFIAASVCLFFMKEPPLSSERTEQMPLREFARLARELMLTNPDFRRAVGLWFLCNFIFSCLMFYATFGIECVGAEAWKPMVAGLLVAQTMARAFSAVIMGQLADRWGNRLVMRILSFALVAWPLMGVVLSRYATPEHPWYWAPVYLMVGVVIPLGPICENYILEVTPVERHSSSLGIANGLMVGVAFGPLAVGALIDGFWFIPACGHRAVFTGIAVLMLAAIYFSMRLGEPRFQAEPRRAPPLA